MALSGVENKPGKTDRVKGALPQRGRKEIERSRKRSKTCWSLIIFLESGTTIRYKIEIKTRN